MLAGLLAVEDGMAVRLLRELGVDPVWRCASRSSLAPSAEALVLPGRHGAGTPARAARPDLLGAGDPLAGRTEGGGERCQPVPVRHPVPVGARVQQQLGGSHVTAVTGGPGPRRHLTKLGRQPG